MGTHLHNTGEEVIMKDFFEESITKPTSISVSLFNDSSNGNGNNLVDGDDVNNITTEPSAGGSYNRSPLSFGTSSFTAESNAEGNWQTVFSDMTFNTTDETTTVDAYFVTIEFASEEAGDGGTPSEHLLFTGALDQSYDLSQIDSFTLSGAGLEIE